MQRFILVTLFVLLMLNAVVLGFQLGMCATLWGSIRFEPPTQHGNSNEGHTTLVPETPSVLDAIPTQRLRPTLRPIPKGE